jgi:hypothetical protein
MARLTSLRKDTMQSFDEGHSPGLDVNKERYLTKKAGLR